MSCQGIVKAGIHPSRSMAPQRLQCPRCAHRWQAQFSKNDSCPKCLRPLKALVSKPDADTPAAPGGTRMSRTSLGDSGRLAGGRKSGRGSFGEGGRPTRPVPAHMTAVAHAYMGLSGSGAEARRASRASRCSDLPRRACARRKARPCGAVGKALACGVLAAQRMEFSQVSPMRACLRVQDRRGGQHDQTPAEDLQARGRPRQSPAADLQQARGRPRPRVLRHAADMPRRMRGACSVRAMPGPVA